jgi:hypothetical protein
VGERIAHHATRIPAGKKIVMKEASKQVVDLFRAPARTTNEKQGFKVYKSPKIMACSTVAVQVCL